MTRTSSPRRPPPRPATLGRPFTRWSPRKLADHSCSVCLVAELMRELGLKACQPRASKRTAVPGEQPVESPDLIDGVFTAASPGIRLVGDIAYLTTGQGWPHLATVIDLATRVVVGWQLAKHMRTGLVVDALDMAISHGHVTPQAVFHSDRGARYTSRQFALFCTANAVRTSVGRTGVCFDNAAAESFFAALKNETYHRQAFATRARAGFAVANHIEVFYNRMRLHSALGYRTAAEALSMFTTAATAA